MKKELLREGLRCKMLRLVTDHEGAVYKDDVVCIVDWTDVSKSEDVDGVVVFVTDDVGKHHTVSLNDIKPL